MIWRQANRPALHTRAQADPGRAADLDVA